MHRPLAPERTVILMVEGAGIIPVGDGAESAGLLDGDESTEGE
jgi:hypothetical protein